MTKKHFIAIAKVIAEAMEGTADAEAVRQVALGLAQEFRGLNHLFDEARFLAACGVDL